MKLHFEDNLDYQNAAVESIVGLFRGQEVSRSEFTVTLRPESGPNASLGMDENHREYTHRDCRGKLREVRREPAERN